MGSEPYLDQNLEQKLIDKLPSVYNITLSDLKRALQKSMNKMAPGVEK
jgi:hypothetical protein